MEEWLEKRERESGEPQMEKKVKGEEMSRGGGNAEGLVNIALDIHSLLVPVCPSSSFPPLYI